MQEMAILTSNPVDYISNKFNRVFKELKMSFKKETQQFKKFELGWS